MVSLHFSQLMSIFAVLLGVIIPTNDADARTCSGFFSVVVPARKLVVPKPEMSSPEIGIVQRHGFERSRCS